MPAWFIIERGLAIAYFICGISLILNTDQWKSFLEEFEKGTSAFLFGFLTLFLGAFMVSSHNIWEFSPRLITTIISWGALIKGAILLVHPGLIVKLTKKVAPSKSLLQADGALALVLASIIYYYA